jgi:predicted metalloprotease
MRPDQMRESDNVEDRRGMSPRMMAGGGLGIGGIIVVIIYVLLGGNPQQLLQQLPPGGSPLGPGAASTSATPVGPRAPLPNDKGAEFVRRVLGDTEDVWRDLFQKAGERYQEPTLVLFSGSVDSACGFASAASGPFYCPGDSKVYIDLAFYDELSTRFGAPGDFAQAYVIAHEVGHHVQHLLGISDKVDAMRRSSSEAEANRLSVKLELQADFLAGVWAHHAQQSRAILESGDLEEALRCATAIGDDTLQRQARGRVVPESFTHGSAQQRVYWFKRGFETGDINQGDTFGEIK